MASICQGSFSVGANGTTTDIQNGSVQTIIQPLTVSAATTFHVLGKVNSTSGFTNVFLYGSTGTLPILKAVCAYL